ncbi:pancreatic lipase-related protein 3-like [Eriocheir sinensis]|uniref:pancreatic lipase-related protein 3-like n=1 Tax=Eriocheir sinensis TaxID=95602 RepID=UPI0021CA3B12|nr:pancreatic lipase-related protein 3-like [Eriocheir sinensis]
MSSSPFPLLSLFLLPLLLPPCEAANKTAPSTPVPLSHTPVSLPSPSPPPSLPSSSSPPDPISPVPSLPSSKPLLPDTNDSSGLHLITPDHTPVAPSTPGPNDVLHKIGGDEEGKEEEEEEGNETQVKGKKREVELLMVKNFYLWTRRNQGNSSAQHLNPAHNETIINSFFRPRKTYVIIHGFLGWGTEGWILHLKDKLLATMNSNVISVDWPAGTEWWLPGYYTAVSRVPKVAKDLLALLRGLVTLWDLDLGDVHLVGHSLGAHAAGLAAAPLSTVGRISGLDPAGLMYHNVPSDQRLDSSDADYVDVIHTNGCKTLNKWLDCYGINENLGHSDFWPNGGRHQPYCGTRKRVNNGEIGCSHEMAYVYFIESLNYNVDQTFFLARPCSSWDEFSSGKCSCGWQTQYMGFSVNMRLNGTFYLHTNSTAPFAEKDSACQPGSATGSGVRIIELALIISSAFISSGAAIGGIAQLVARRRGAMRREESGGGDSVASGSGTRGVGNGDVVMDGSDCEPLLA